MAHDAPILIPTAFRLMSCMHQNWTRTATLVLALTVGVILLVQSNARRDRGNAEAVDGKQATPADRLNGGSSRSFESDVHGRLEDRRVPVLDSSTKVARDSFGVVQFLSGHGQEVEGVVVIDSNSDTPDVLARSGEDGRARLRGEGSRARTFMAFHRDYLVEEFSMAPSEEGIQVVILDSGSSISGHVRFADGSVEFDSVQVLATPFERLPTAAQVEARLERGWDSTGSFRVVPVDRSGRFTIRGLRGGRRYYVTAAGSQCLARAGVQVIGPERNSVELELDWLHGLRTRLVQADGPLRVSSTVRHARGVQTMLHASLPPHRSWEAALAWIPAADLAPSGEHESLYLALGGTRAGLGDQLKLDASVPGYERVTRYIELPPASHHVSVEDVVLTPSGAGWSTLVVQIAGDSHAPAKVPLTQMPAGRLILSHAGEPQCEVLLRNLSEGSSSRHAVPAGHYQARFVSSAGSYLWPSPPDTISLDLTVEEALLSIPLGECGGLDLTLKGPEGRLFEDRAIVRLSREDSSGYTHTRFYGAPYAFAALPPGEYYVAALVGPAFLSPGKEPYRGYVEVRAGERADLTLTHR